MYKLLIVDDEEYVRNGLKNMEVWEKLGFKEVDVAQNAQVAFRMVEKSIPHVVLTDIKMPGLSGIELAVKIKSKYPGIKIVILSAYSDFEYTQKAIKYGVAGYLLKPIKQDLLIEIFSGIITELKKSKSHTQTINNKKKSISESREYVLKNIMEGIDSIDFVNQELDRYRLNYLKNYVRVVLCHFKPSDYTYKMKKFIVDKIGEYWDKFDYPVVSYMGNIVILFNSVHGISRIETQKLLQEFNDYINMITKQYYNKKIKLYFGVGNLNNDIRMISRSYSEALFSYNQKYFTNGFSVFYQDLNIKGYEALESKEVDKITDKLYNSIFSRDLNSIKISIHSLYSIIDAKGHFSVEDIQSKFADVLQVLEYQLKQKGINLENKNKANLLNKVRNINTYDGLRKWFEKTIKEFVEEIKNKKSDNVWFVSKAKEYAKRNIDEKISLENIADYLHMNSAYFSVSFKKITGQSFIDYVTNLKIEKAKEMLKTCEYKINEISIKLGYNESSYFCMVFKKKTGLTPLEYRTKKVLFIDKDKTVL